MADATTEMILRVKADVDKAKKDLDDLGGKVDNLGKKSKSSEDSFTSGLVPSISKAGIAAGVAAGAFAVLQKAIGNAIEKQTSLAQFSQITGIVGEDLKSFGDAADDLAVKFGTSAIDNIESFKGVLSRLGPDFASSQEALTLMGENINTLALASGLDATQAMDALTTAMLQFGVDLSDPLAAAKDAQYMMNVMAAAAKEGAAEVPDLSEALKQVGVTAKGLNQSFEETNAALETLAVGGKFGSEAGVSLRNVMASMTKVSKMAADELNSYNIGADELGKILTTKGVNAAMERLKTALAENGDAAEDAALLTSLFGKENMAAAQILIDNTKLTDELTEAIGGTTTANDQASIALDTVAGRWSQVSAKFDVILTKIGDFFLPIVEAAVSKINAWVGQIERLGGAVKSLLSFDFAGAWKQLNGEADDAAKSTGKIAKEMRTSGAAAQTAAAQIETQTNAYRNQATVAAELSEAKERLANATSAEMERKARADVARLTQEMKKWESSTKSQAAKIKPLTGTLGALNDALKTESDILENKLTPYTDEWTAQATKVAALEAQIDMHEERMDVLAGTYDYAKLKAKGFKDETAQIAATISAAQPVLDKAVGAIQLLDTTSAEANFASYLTEEFKKLDEETQKFVNAGRAIGDMFSAAAFEEEGFKGALKQMLNLLISFAEAQLLIGTSVAALQTIFGNFGGLIALAGAVAALEVARAGVASFRTGIDYVPRDAMPAILHKGEKVLTNDEADEYRRGNKSPASTVKIAFTRFETAIEGNHINRSRRYA